MITSLSPFSCFQASMTKFVLPFVVLHVNMYVQGYTRTHTHTHTPTRTQMTSLRRRLPHLQRVLPSQPTHRVHSTRLSTRRAATPSMVLMMIRWTQVYRCTFIRIYLLCVSHPLAYSLILSSLSAVSLQQTHTHTHTHTHTYTDGDTSPKSPLGHTASAVTPVEIPSSPRLLDEDTGDEDEVDDDDGVPKTGIFLFCCY